MITRENFVQTMSTLETLATVQKNAEAALGACGLEATGNSPFWFMFDLLTDTLGEAIGTDDAADWISYFIWERHWLHDEGACVYEDDTPVSTNNWGEVYDFITRDVKNDTDEDVLRAIKRAGDDFVRDFIRWVCE